MDECLIDNWNSVVGSNDLVYHLGDVYFGDGKKALPKLNGKKHLILGNHDKWGDSSLNGVFSKISIWKRINELNVLMTHVPIDQHELLRPYDNPSRPWFINLHGHTHDQIVSSERHINVCVEQTDYKPVELESLID